ncbi:MAG: Gfo/Idh/MocA family oxidoreductase [Planctomycetota bacterium]|nr:Gfo/Idh/MocA family oxidoreductase [Planctomycetota bacterium]
MNDEETMKPAGNDRRDFLKGAALAAGAIAISGNSLLGSERIGAKTGVIGRAARRTPLGDDGVVRMGVIGTGGMGGGHIDSFLRFATRGEDKVKIVAVCDVNHKRRAVAESKINKAQGDECTVYNDYLELLARDDIHGVLIASPEHWHAQMAEDALMAGKDVYLEKPMTLRLPEALRLRQVVLNNPDVLLQVGTQKIMLPKYKAAQAMVAEGAIGKPTFSQTSYCRNSRDGEWKYYGIDPEWKPGVNVDWDRWCGPAGVRDWNPALCARWRRYKDFSTGIVGDLLVHEITPLMMALDQGWPTRVVATGGHYIDKAMENHDQVNLQIQFEKGHTLIVAGSTCNEMGLETMIRGHQGTIYLNGGNCKMVPQRLFADDVEPQEVICESIGNDQDALRRNWLDCIRTRRQPDSNVDLGTKVIVAVDLATRSMWEGKAFEFDPSSMTATSIG